MTCAKLAAALAHAATEAGVANRAPVIHEALRACGHGETDLNREIDPLPWRDGDRETWLREAVQKAVETLGASQDD